MSELLHAQLERSADLHPDRLALRSGDRSVTYAELEAMANRIANTLLAAGISPGQRVGLFLDKSVEAVAGLYGVMKTGAAYVPVDPAAPAARVAHILNDCKITTLISSAAKSAAWQPIRDAGAEIATLLLPDVSSATEAPKSPGSRLITGTEIAEQPNSRPAAPGAGDDLAILLYTSGSTGTPKGVMLSHRNVMAFAGWAAEEFSLTADDRVSQLAPLHFDLSTFDLFATARAAASVHLMPRQTLIFPMQVRRFLEAERISVVYSVPSILTQLTERTGLTAGDLPDLRTVLFAGEVFPTKYLSRLMRQLPGAEFANLFGPTETNVCTFYRVPQAPAEEDPPVLIGRAISGVTTSVVGADGQRVAPGEAGELWVRGPTVMQGYWPDRTDDAAGDKDLYRTGDLVRETASGDYEFIGRRDSQIKSRGYRIELGDIEAALLAHPDILECAVVPIPDDQVTNRIKAWVVVQNGLEEGSIVAFVADRLPRYMIPESFAFSDQLPKTSTGKINRQQLSATTN